MKNFKKTPNITGQSNESVPKSRKHDANLQKNSTLYFQIGLILCLLGSYAILEMRFESKSIAIDEVAFIDDLDTFDVKNYVVEPEQKIEKQVKKQSQRLVDTEPVVVDNDVEIVEQTIDIAKPDVLDSPLPVSAIVDVEKPVDDIIDENTIIDLRKVERVPIYPGCEKATNNAERLKCMSSKMNKLIQRKFNTDLAGQLQLEGIQRIDVQFKIDRYGKVTDIKTRSPYDLLEQEAQRVVNKIPTMTPGMQREKPVSVMYYLPIKFKVQ